MTIAVTVDSRIRHVAVTGETITAYLTDGRVVSVPLAWSWRLTDATPAQRANWQLIGDGHGVHWPDIDEDLSLDGLLNGIPARRPNRTPAERPASRRASNSGQRKAKTKHRSRKMSR